MNRRRVYVDTNVWIAAVQGTARTSERALDVLENRALQLLVSRYVRLEALPKPVFNGRNFEIALLHQLFARAEEISLGQEAIVERAIEIAGLYDIGPMDALHVSTAEFGGADEFVTLEKPTKPLFRVTSLSMTSIWRPDAL